MDTEDKFAWCEQYGDVVESAFCVNRLYDLGLSGYMNPEKKTNKYSHDMFMVFQSDLKTVRTPLYKAKELFNIDPQYAVTFNLKDAERYKKLYPNIAVVFDVMWDESLCSKTIGGQKYVVAPMHHTYVGFLTDIRNAIIASGNKKIEYQNRINDMNGNAKESYVFDVRKLHLISEAFK